MTLFLFFVYICKINCKNMKKFGLYVAVMGLALAMCTGCDFIRASLGKPTSADLNKISAEVKAREQYLRDSVAAVRAAEARLAAGDTSAVVPAPAPAEAAAVKPAETAVVQQPTAVAPTAPAAPAAADSPLKKYYAVAGAFKNPEGAEEYVKKLEEKGFQVRLFDFRSGLKVVCVGGSDSIEDARADVAALRELKLSDSDPWIYNTNQKLHK